MRRTSQARKSILIVDAQPLMRHGLVQLINNEDDLVASSEADTAAQALNMVVARQPDLVLLDVSLPDKSGLELIKDIRVFHPFLPVLVFSMHEESIYAERVLRAGGRGYIMKQESGKKLLEAIRQVLGGRIYVSEKISARILEVFSRRSRRDVREVAESPVEHLSDREFEVFQMIGQGHGTRQIADHLHLSVKTVDVHRANIKRKLRLRTAPELVRYAVRWIESRPFAPLNS